MGMLTDVVALGKKKPATVLRQPYESAPWFQWKGIGMVELAQLGALLEVAPVQKLVSQFKLLGGDEAVLVSFPDALADSIRELSGKDANAVAKKWAKTEELEGTKPKELAEYLTSLAAFLTTHQGPYGLFLSP